MIYLYHNKLLLDGISVCSVQWNSLACPIIDTSVASYSVKLIGNAYPNQISEGFQPFEEIILTFGSRRLKQYLDDLSIWLMSNIFYMGNGHVFRILTGSRRESSVLRNTLRTLLSYVFCILVSTIHHTNDRIYI